MSTCWNIFPKMQHVLLGEVAVGWKLLVSLIETIICAYMLWQLQKEAAVNKNCCSDLFSVCAQSIQATLCT